MAKWHSDMPSPSETGNAMTVPASDLATDVARALPMDGNAVLAVSGGLDSMTLLDVASKARRDRNCAVTVATFDHRSGPYGEAAVAHVANAALAYGLEVVIGRAERPARTEEGWRAARWEFLGSVARRMNSVVLTAHTRDDQVETVLMRAMRGAGARGLAGLYAPSVVRRPLLGATRAELRAYALTSHLAWLDDPTNQSRRHLRNRVRHDLLPALRAVRPTIEAELLAISEEAAAWRAELASMVEESVNFRLRREWPSAALDVDAEDLQQYTADSLRIVWPELASRIALVLDGRGARRAAEFTKSERVGARVQLSGGWELHRSRERLELRRISPRDAANELTRLTAPMIWDRWSFEKGARADRDVWRGTFSADQPLWIRPWRPGDRLIVRHGERLIARKVKYFLSDAAISGHIRGKWPVVLAGDEIVWIPGVRRSDAATARSGGPVVTYVCDYLDRRS